MPDSVPCASSGPSQPAALDLEGGGRSLELVRHDSRLCLEGWWEEPGRDPWQCSTWLGPMEAPEEVPHRLLHRPSCCLSTGSSGF